MAKSREGADVLEGPPVLRDVDELGPRFAAVVGRPPGWIPAADLFGDRLAEQIAAVAEHFGASRAVAGTLLLQQYAGLLAAPVLAALHREGRILGCSMSDVCSESVGGRPVRIAFASSSHLARGDHAEARRDVADALVDGHLLPAASAIHALTRAGTRVLNGAVAYAVATAYLQLSWRRPDPAHHLADASEVLERTGLGGLVELTTVEIDGAQWLHAIRQTCCLAFRTGRHRKFPDAFCTACPVQSDTAIESG